MKSLAAAIAILILAGILSPAFTQEPTCRLIRAEGASFLKQCGDQIHSFALSLSDIRREAGRNLHGWFGFHCPIELMCVGQPDVNGFFFAPQSWQSGPKDERAIFALLHSIPLMAATWHYRGGQPPPMPEAGCPLFDVQIGDMVGRAVCFTGANGSAVVVIAADDRVGFVLSFNQRDQTVAALRARVADLIPRFKIERGSGDAALLRWIK